MSDFGLIGSVEKKSESWDFNKCANGLVSEAYDLWNQTTHHPEQRLRQVQGLVHGLGLGIGYEITHHPKDVLWDLFSGPFTGMVAGGFMMAESKRTALVGTVCAAGLAAKWLVDKTSTNADHPDNRKRNTAINAALNILWKNDDLESYKSSVGLLSEHTGAILSDLGEAYGAMWFAGRVTGGYKSLLSRQLF